MEIIIENCSSAGAHFSDNTNAVLLKIYKWINENNEPVLPFIDFRRRLEIEKKINDNNARNIFPLLKNGGFADYQAGEMLNTTNFFTPEGKAYVMGLDSLEMINNGDYSEQQKKDASAEMNSVLRTLVYGALINLLKNPSSYNESMKWFLMYLLEFEKVDKNEFAYMVYQMHRDSNGWADEIRDNVRKYRNKEISINVQVRVRNDQRIQRETGETTRLGDISYFTAFNYYSALYLQAGLTIKDSGYHFLKQDMRDKVEALVEG